MAPCVCGHPEADHGMSGRCHVPSCPCEQFEPVPQIAGVAWPRPPIPVVGPWGPMTLPRGRL